MIRWPRFSTISTVYLKRRNKLVRCADLLVSHRNEFFIRGYNIHIFSCMVWYFSLIYQKCRQEKGAFGLHNGVVAASTSRNGHSNCTHTCKYYMHKVSNGITNIPSCLFSESSSWIKTFLWLEEKKKKEKLAPTPTHPDSTIRTLSLVKVSML